MPIWVFNVQWFLNEHVMETLFFKPTFIVLCGSGNKITSIVAQLRKITKGLKANNE